jgi:hypothetical protein
MSPGVRPLPRRRLDAAGSAIRDRYDPSDWTLSTGRSVSALARSTTCAPGRGDRGQVGMRQEPRSPTSRSPGPSRPHRAERAMVCSPWLNGPTAVSRLNQQRGWRVPDRPGGQASDGPVASSYQVTSRTVRRTPFPVFPVGSTDPRKGTPRTGEVRRREGQTPPGTPAPPVSLISGTPQSSLEGGEYFLSPSSAQQRHYERTPLRVHLIDEGAQQLRENPR